MRLAAYAFAAEVECQIAALTNAQFHLRQGTSKTLQKEWHPISRLGLHLKQPGLEVEVEAFGDSGVADARIYEAGFRNREFDIQVTYVHDYKEALRKELMVSQGFAPGAGPIFREKLTGTVLATVSAVDADHHICDHVKDARTNKSQTQTNRHATYDDTGANTRAAEKILR